MHKHALLAALLLVLACAEPGEVEASESNSVKNAFGEIAEDLRDAASGWRDSLRGELDGLEDELAAVKADLADASVEAREQLNAALDDIYAQRDDLRRQLDQLAEENDVDSAALKEELLRASGELANELRELARRIK